MVLNFGDKPQKVAKFHYNKIGPRRDSRIVVKEQIKRYLPVLQKGIVNDELEVLPFGF